MHHPNFGFPMQQNKYSDDNPNNPMMYNRSNEPPRTYPAPSDPSGGFYSYPPPSADDSSPSPQIPHHIRVLFENDERMNFENRSQYVNPQNVRGKPEDFRPMGQGGQNQMSMANLMQIQQLQQQLQQQNYPQPTGHYPPNTYTTTNATLGSLPDTKEGLTSLGDTSRDSQSRGSMQNLSKKNTSSRVNAGKDKTYQKTINEDITLTERIESLLNQITLNHNKFCPFCSKIIDIKKCNFQNISAFMSNTTRKFYLTHFDCYLKSSSNVAASQILSLSGVIEAKLNAQINALTNIDTSNFIRADRKAYFISIEGFHPISSYLFFRIDKLGHGLEHATHRNSLLYVNLSNGSTSIFEPNSYAIPFSEFRLVITIHASHSNEDPYIYEMLLNFSQVRATAEQKIKPVEVYFQQEEQNVIIGTNIVYDANAELPSQLNSSQLDSSFQSTGSSTSVKPDFGKNLFVVLKYFTISLPLKRLEKSFKQPSAVPQQLQQSIEDAKGDASKKTQSKLRLNANAPLFTVPGQNDPRQQGGNPPPEPQQQPKPFNPAGNNFNPYAPAQEGNMAPGMRPAMGVGIPMGPGNMNSSPALPPNLPNAQGSGGYYGQMMFGQNFQAEQGSQDPSQYGGKGEQGGQKELVYPPNLFPQNFQQVHRPPGLNMSPMLPKPMQQQQQQSQQGFPGPQQMFQQGNAQNMTDAASKKRPLQVETTNLRPLQPGEMVPALEFPETPMTPESSHEKGRLKSGPINLYTAVLSGKGKEGMSSPSLNKIQSKYFSNASTPKSERGFTLSESNTPMDRGVDRDLGNDLHMDDEPWTEDMIENFKLEDYIDNLVEFAKTYNGSRVLQKFFPRATQVEIDAVITKIQDSIEDLMLDPYANYMFQTLAQSCTPEQRFNLLQKIAPSMIKIACDRKGTHSLQAIVSLINRDMEEELIRETLDGHVLELALDAQGTHLIQKLVAAISIKNIDFIYEPVIQRFTEVTNNAFGLCVLKQIMTKAERVDTMRETLIYLLHDNLEELIQNPYGNYAVQHAFDSYPKSCDKIFDKILDKIIQYSNQKFSSNVIEKCLILSTPDYRKKFVREITKNDRIVELMKNKYGNFVIFKLLNTGDAEDKAAVAQSIVKNVNTVNVVKYKNKWIQFIEDNPLKIPGFSNFQIHKPSLFKNNSPRLPPAEEPLSREVGGDNELGWMEDDWNDPRQQQQQMQKRGMQKNMREEKSHFYYNKQTSSMGSTGEEQYAQQGFNMMKQQPEYGFVSGPGAHGRAPAPQGNMGFAPARPGMPMNAGTGGARPAAGGGFVRQGNQNTGNMQGYPEQQNFGGGTGQWGYNKFY